MIDKEQILKFIDEVGDEGKCIFGNMFWEYFKLAAKEYEGKKITQEQMSELAMIAFHKTTPSMLSDDEVRKVKKVFDKHNLPDIARNPDGTHAVPASWVCLPRNSITCPDFYDIAVLESKEAAYSQIGICQNPVKR